MTEKGETQKSKHSLTPRSDFRVPRSKYRAVVIGSSAGGMTALGKLLSALPRGFSLTVIVVQHLHPTEGGYLMEYLNNKCTLPVKEVEDKEPVLPGYVYLAPPNYHLLVEREGTFSLSIDGRVNHSRPSIDVLFESAARVWPSLLLGVILTGANYDGTYGLKFIKESGGLTIAQDPATAESPVMPQAAINAGVVDRVMTLEEIGELLVELGTRNGEPSERGTRNAEGGRGKGQDDRR